MIYLSIFDKLTLRRELNHLNNFNPDPIPNLNTIKLAEFLWGLLYCHLLADG